MGNLIRTEWYRFWKYPTFRHLEIAVCLLSVLISFGLTTFSMANPYDHSPLYGYEAASNLFPMYPGLLCLFVMPVLVYTVCSSFRNKTFRHERLSGHSTSSMIISRLIVGVGLTTLISLICVFLMVGFFTAKNGWCEEWAVPNAIERGFSAYFYVLLTLTFVIAQVASVSILSAIVTKEPASALILSWLFYLLGYGIIDTAANTAADAYQRLSLFVPGWQLTSVEYLLNMHSETSVPTAYIFYGLIVGILELLPLYILAHIRIKFTEH